MILSHKQIKELRSKLSLTAKSLMAYCIIELQNYPEDIASTLSVDLSFENCKDDVTSNKSYFYKAIKELEEHGFLLKYKPKRFIVNPHYVSALDKKQIDYLVMMRYHILQDAIDRELLNEFK